MTEPTTEAGRRLLELGPWGIEERYGTDDLRNAIIAIEQEARADLDVERLARALATYDYRRVGPTDDFPVLAAAIAAAYREDAG